MIRRTALPKDVYAVVAKCSGTILLETSRFDSSNEQTYLFREPIGVVSVNRLSDVSQLFSQIDDALAKGLYVAGFLSYECAYHFEHVSDPNLTSGDPPLAWFGLYSSPLVFNHARGHFEDSNLAPSLALAKDNVPEFVVDRVALDIAEDDYYAKIRTIKERIAAGETYQVNFTDSVSFKLPMSSAAAFETLSKQQPVSYSAFLNVAAHHILSFSPELFFRIDDGRIVTRPMKGTMPRGLDANEDEQASFRLQNDDKNRSEHVMIVDLLRNDLGRICEMGSVRAENLFSVEKYETLFQMTSTISGTLRPGISYYDIFRSMFPSGSVTGAPKIRTMQIIRELERSPRGVYTGTIGFMSPNGSSVFNVAIRTLVIKESRARMGVGGGIVADSEPSDEHQECLLKASFLTRPHHDFQLIDTMLWKKSFHFLPMHLARLESSASYFNFVFDHEAILAQLHGLSKSFMADKVYRVRLLLSSTGKLEVESSEFQTGPSTGYVKLSSERTSSIDIFMRHKTTHREIYDRQYAEARADGFDEVIFQNEKGEVTEGAISNIFIEQAGQLFTPPLTCGLLPGVFRRFVLETCSAATERIVTVEDLKTADGVFLCNSVRGVREVNSLYFRGIMVKFIAGSNKVRRRLRRSWRTG